MSRVGKKPIEIPESVTVKISDNSVIIKGPKGELTQAIRPEIKVEVKNKKILILPEKETSKTSAFWGLTRALIFNQIQGVTEGFEKKLELQGIGYRARVEGEELILEVGLSHPIKIKCPEGIKFEVQKNIISVSGPSKQKVGEVAAKIRAVKKPEPYKGKGIRYQGEVVRRKAGKKAVTVG